MKKVLDFFFPTQRNGHRPVVLGAEALSVIFLALFSSQLFYNLSLFEQERLPRGDILGFATNIYQAELVRLTNEEREKQSRPPLSEDPLLSGAAQHKAQNMFDEDYWAHVAPSGLTPWHWFDEVGYAYLMAGENLAKDFNTSAGVVGGWMGSESHRNNLLNPNFTEIGIAVVNGKLSGEETTLVVQLFGTPLSRTMALASLESESARSRPSSSTAGESSGVPEPPKISVSNLGVAGGAQGDKLEESFAPTVGEQVEMPSPSSSTAAKVRLALNPLSYTPTQLFTILVLALLIFLFATDSFILWRLGIERKNSHSLLHAGTLTLLLAAVIWQSKGAVL